MVLAESWTLESGPVEKAGTAIGIFGRAAPTIRMSGTEGMGASGGGVAPDAGGCGPAVAVRAAQARRRGRSVHRESGLT